MSWNNRIHALLSVIFICGQICYGNQDGQDGGAQDEVGERVATRLVDQVRAVLEHYKSPDPIGLPWKDRVPDPMPIPNIKPPFSLANLNMFNCTVHGLSRFRIESVQSNLADMQVLAAVRIETLEVRGNYTLATWLSRSAGGCTVTLSDVYVMGMAVMAVARRGHLEASDIEMDIAVERIALDFRNLGFLASIFQGMMNSVGSFVFDSIKPFILREVNAKLMGDVNSNLRAMRQTFPNSIPPLDLAVVMGRHYVKGLGYDPYKVPDFSQTAGVFGVYVTQTHLSGLASFYRVDNMTVSMQSNVVQAGLKVATERLEGSCQWELSAAGLYSHLGHTCFTLDYVKVEAKVSQPLDVRKRPKLDLLELELGNIQLRQDGTGSLDYALELAANVLPNLLRYQILDALEEPLKRKVQDILDEVDVEKVILERLPQLERMVKGENASSNTTSTTTTTSMVSLKEAPKRAGEMTSTTDPPSLELDEEGLVIGGTDLDSTTF